MLNRYYDEWLKVELDSEVVDVIEENGKYWVACKESVFYVEGGGMASDTGTLNDVLVENVKLVNNLVYHLVSEKLKGVVHQKVDLKQRIMKAQIHTAQHLMCGIINKKYHAPTNSFFNDDFEAGIEMLFDYFDEKTMHEIEELCNHYIREDLKVKIIYPSKEEALKHVGLEKVEHEKLRAVLIGDIDYNMCACIHVPSLRYIQMIKFQRFEKTARGYKIYFLCGNQLLESYEKQLSVLTKTSHRLVVPQLEVYDAVEKLKLEMKQMIQKEAELKQKYSELFIEKLVEKYKEDIIVEMVNDMDIKSFTTMCSILVRKYQKGVMMVLHQSDRAHIVIAHNGNMNFSCQDMFKKVASSFSLRGGGNVSMAQGGGLYSEKMLPFLNKLKETIDTKK